jgi:hypothetical protein
MAQSIVEITTTWNSGATVFHGIKLNVTDTTSAATSRLFTFQVGGTDKIYALKTGALVSASTLTAAGLVLTTGGTINFNSSNVVLTHSTGVLTVSTGDLRVTNPGEEENSVLTVSSAAAMVGSSSTTAGDVGTYMFAAPDVGGSTSYDPGDTIAGSSLQALGINFLSEVDSDGEGFSGTWQSMGYSASGASTSFTYGSLWVRTV